MLLGALMIADGTAASTLVSRTLAPGSHPGSRERVYQVFVPDDLAAGAAAPVVMVLHGCLQSEQNMIRETRFTELAEREGFIVVFPFITSQPSFPVRAQNCWGFFIEEHRHEGLGEPADLRRILQAVEDEFPVDPNRRYVTGLSSGAAMAVVMAVAYSEDFAAAGAVAGLPFTENACAVQNACFSGIEHKPVAAIVDAMADEQRSPDEQRLVPLMVIHSLNDMTVPIKNAYNLRDSWIARYGARSAPSPLADCSAEGVACEHVRFADGEGRTVVETVLYNGPLAGTTHFWPGDNAGTFADPDGPSASELLWSFFQQHTLAPDAQAEISIEAAEVVRGNLQEHILAGRIAVQRPPCVSGFGVCDTDFNTLFFQHGLEAFALHNPAGTDRWYADPENVPSLR